MPGVDVPSPQTAITPRSPGVTQLPRHKHEGDANWLFQHPDKIAGSEGKYSGFQGGSLRAVPQSYSTLYSDVSVGFCVSSPSELQLFSGMSFSSPSLESYFPPQLLFDIISKAKLRRPESSLARRFCPSVRVIRILKPCSVLSKQSQ